ncbi:MAG TPA: GxxExxY protein [Candidatus Cloacimonadota bacterium]|nr:GxxExxY protein [Candidatus Cloacimonadota bacterium]HPT71228.1 GxxExxY protein [Candidatus Cloacimonadota bacterium]
MNNIRRSDLLYPEEVFKIQGAIFEVYKELGCGFLESVYQECLQREFTSRNIPFIAQQILTANYKGKLLEQTYKADFICYEKIVIELKASKTIIPEHQAQIINYLKISGLRLGLLVNFGHYPKVEIKRIVL